LPEENFMMGYGKLLVIYIKRYLINNSNSGAFIKVLMEGRIWKFIAMNFSDKNIL